MVYIITEDSSDGYRLIENIINTDYKEYAEHIQLVSSNGIRNIPQMLKANLSIYNDTKNTTIVVFDYITENESIAKYVEEVSSYEYRYDNVHLIKTKSFEVEALMIDNVQLLGDVNAYGKFFKDVKEILRANDGKTISATRFVSTKPQYKEMRDSIIKKKSKGSFYEEMVKELGKKKADDFIKSSITIETIAKKILTEVFKNQMIPIKKCWTENCCYTVTTCNHKNLNREKIEKEQEKCEKYKLKIFIANTKYIKVFKELDRALSKELNTTVNKSSGIQGEMLDLINQTLA